MERIRQSKEFYEKKRIQVMNTIFGFPYNHMLTFKLITIRLKPLSTMLGPFDTIASTLTRHLRVMSKATLSYAIYLLVKNRGGGRLLYMKIRK